MKQPHHIVPVALLSGFALCVGACSDDFAPYNRLTRTRVLALSADPVNPAPGQSTTITPLLYVPPANAQDPVTYAWSWCPVLGVANDGYQCPFTNDEWQQGTSTLGLSDPGPPLQLGQGPTQDWKNAFPTSTLNGLCTGGLLGYKPDCSSGFPVRIYIKVTQGTLTETATEILYLPTADGVPSNAIPRFDESMGPVFTFAKLNNNQETPITDAVPVLPRLVDSRVYTKVAESAAETYRELGSSTDVQERLVLTWFVETGDVADERTSWYPDVTDFSAFLKNKWKPGKAADYAPSQAQLIGVLRDNRGGVSWASTTVALEPTP